MTRKEMIRNMLSVLADVEACSFEPGELVTMMVQGPRKEVVNKIAEYGLMTDAEVEEAYDKHLEKCLEENFECRHGDVFTLKDGGKYILALVFSGDRSIMVALINMRDGNRWRNAVHVRNSFSITKEEFGEICGHAWKEAYKTREPYGGRI